MNLYSYILTTNAIYHEWTFLTFVIKKDIFHISILLNNI